MLYSEPYYSFDTNKISQTMNFITQISVPVNVRSNLQTHQCANS